MSDYSYASLEVEKVVLHPQGPPSADDAVSKSYVDTKVSDAVAALVDSSPGTLDTLKEIATALGNDANLATTLANSISSERTERKVNESILTNQLGALQVSTSSAMTQEIAAREAAVSAVQTAITSEISLRDEQKISIDSAISQEEMFRSAAVADLEAKLSEETLSRSGNDTQLGERITSEESRATAVESLHGEQLSSLDASKLNKAGDMMTGDLMVASSGSIVLEDSYLYFGTAWRVKASGSGDRIVFEYKKNGVWKMALPFIAPA